MAQEGRGDSSQALNSRLAFSASGVIRLGRLAIRSSNCTSAQRRHRFSTSGSIVRPAGGLGFVLEAAEVEGRVAASSLTAVGGIFLGAAAFELAPASDAGGAKSSSAFSLAVFRGISRDVKGSGLLLG